MKQLKIGLFAAGGKLTMDDTFLKYQHPYGAAFRVPLAEIKTVTVDTTVGWGKAMLKIMGDGMELASAKMVVGWANKCQEWILANR